MKISEVVNTLHVPDFSSLDREALKQVLTTLKDVLAYLEEEKPVHGYVCHAFSRMHTKRFTPGGKQLAHQFLFERMSVERMIGASCTKGLTNPEQIGYVNSGFGVVGRALLNTIEVQGEPEYHHMSTFCDKVTNDDGSPIRGITVGCSIRIAWVKKILAQYQ